MARDMTAQALAGELEINEKTLRRYIKAGCPHDGRGRKSDPYTFDRAEVAAWMAAAKLSGKPGRPMAEVSEAIKAAQLRILIAKAEKAETELAQTKGELLPRAEVEAGRIARIQFVKGGLLGLGPALAPQLVGLSAPDIQARIESEVLNLLEFFSKQ